ncbi:MAG: TIGR03960 family B12-binding radical SAM protein, partial [Desulfovibrionaceae bacterium]|nr:TIGR03960 family B12-binding radical SAM protein [Desulfovibrionaceae bacterium]
VHKNPAEVSLRCVLCFPDLYEVGMSHLGSKILYGIINDHPSWWAERCYEPDAEGCAVLRETGTLLASLESDLPLKDADVVGFSITHEMCYTDVLNMMDLGGIPLRTKDRPEDLRACPLICSGGGAAISAEPMAPFLDCVVLGDGEETMVELLERCEAARDSGKTRSALLEELARVPGIYVPSLFAPDAEGLCHPLIPDLPVPTRRIVADFNAAYSPTKQVVPLSTVHNRLSLEIARGCTRGCRFCNAGFVYRPSRERQVETNTRILKSCLEDTGFDEISFLSLSAGDYSALKHLCGATLDHCAKEQISLSLPSLRVGSIDDEIMDRMSKLRRTGVTLAPEAGSQRLRDVINKGVTEEQLITHVQKLLEYGWRQVKLYFMIGLPTETDEDLLAIVDLCRRVREAGGPGRPKLAVTAALSPFVPKPYTPFQWEDQIGLEEIHRRVHVVLEQFKKIRGLTMRWHEPKVSHLEGILSRAGRPMADVVETAFRKGAILTGWMEHFRLEPWLEALREHGFVPEECIKGSDPAKPLPWSHIECGVSPEYLLKERQRAFEEKVTSDCRYNPCTGCGACDRGKIKSRLATGHEGIRVSNRLVYEQRDQVPNQPARDENGRLIVREFKAAPPRLDPALVRREVTLRVWHEKRAQAAWISQLELQAVLDRALRRANVPMAFSQGFHPLPLVSFGRAMPVGMESLCEWFSITLREQVDEKALAGMLNPCLPMGLRVYRADAVPFKERAMLAVGERFSLTPANPADFDAMTGLFAGLMDKKEFVFTRETKKGPRSTDIRALVETYRVRENGEGRQLDLFCGWDQGYISPCHICQAVLEPLGPDFLNSLHIVKTAQFLPDRAPEEGDDGTR